MTQEVEVTITLEVPTDQTKYFIENYIKYLFERYSLLELRKIKSIKEEAELYGNE